MRQFDVYSFFKDEISLYPVAGGESSMLYNTSIEPRRTIGMQEFFDILRERIETRRMVKELYLDGKDLHIEVVDFSFGEYREEEVILHICIRRGPFKSMLNETIRRYIEVERETLANIETLYNENYDLVDRYTETEEQVVEVLKDFVYNKRVNNVLYDERTMRDAYSFLLNNSSKLLSERTILDSSIWSKILRVSTSLYRHYILTFLGTVAPTLLGAYAFDGSIGLGFGKVGIGLFLANIFNYISNTSGFVPSLIDKQGFKIIKSLIKEIEKVCGFTPETIKPSHAVESELGGAKDDVLLSFIRKDLDYIVNKGIDCQDELKELANMVRKYLKNKEEGSVDRNYFLNWLTELEIRIFASNNRKMDPECSYNESLLDERLEYIGYRFSDDFSDKFVRDVYDAITRILRNPYRGAEKEIVRLFKLAQDYVEMTTVGDEGYFGIGEIAGKMYLSLDQIEGEVTSNVNATIQNEETEVGTVQENHELAVESSTELGSMTMKPLA